MQTGIKKEVSCKALDPLFYFAKQNNTNLNDLIEGLPYDLSFLTNKRERIFWSDWCKIISNARAFFSASEFEEMGRQFVKSNSYKAGLLAAFFIFSSKRLSQFLARLIVKSTSAMFICVKQKIEFINFNHVRISVTIDKKYEFCPEFFYISKGYWGELGAGLGHKNFCFDLNIEDSRGNFNATWNRESLVFRMKRRLRWFLNIRQAFTEMTESQAELLKQYGKINISQNLIQKQRIQLKVANEILKSIKQTYDVEETLNSVSVTLVNTANFSAVFIELFRDMDENQLKINSQAGDFTDLPIPVKKIIIIGNNHVGNLIAYPKHNMDYKDANDLLDYLIPLINITIYNTLILNTIVDYKNNLKQKVSERTSELQIARDELYRTNKLLQQTQLIQNNFFANISHEFRTPLTLILGPAKNILESTQEPQTKQNVSLIKRNAGKLLGLVNQLLDISKLESGNMKLQTTPMNIISLLKGLVLSFSSYAERKRINLNFNSAEDEIIVYVDKEKFEKIITNIFSNALKFTPEGGEVEVKVETASYPSPGGDNAFLKVPSFGGYLEVGKKLFSTNNYLKISIRDTGIGIPADRLEKIFDRFYQVDGSHTREHEGTGIGLSLTKELVELHKGKISVESEPGKGSTFTVSLPLGKEHLRPEEICDEDKAKEYEKEISEIEGEEDKSGVERAGADFFEKDSLPLLILVEDNPDVRVYIKKNLKTDYRILEAVDGEDGWNKAVEQIPDLVISDVMMPKMDGFKFCGKLKTDERTSHIPIILLTAKAAKEDKLAGFETGADEYLMKPFDTDELKSRIKNLISQRKRLQEHFRKLGLAGIDQQKITSVDKMFLQKSFDLINRHISDSSFNVEMLAEELAISQSGLQKKINSLIGETPGDLIRRIRLNKAAEMIKNKFGNLSEIALEVGYNNPAHFSEAFKKQFGMAPSQYQQNNKIL